MRLCFVVLVVVLLAGCGGPNLKDLNLESILIQDGDLPASMIAGQITDGSGGDTIGASGFVKRVERAIEPDGVVTVLLYDDDTALQRDFKAVLPGVTADGLPSTEVGAQAMTRGNIVLFVRCHALVAVRMAITPQVAQQTLGYAKRLDQRLQPLVC